MTDPKATEPLREGWEERVEDYRRALDAGTVLGAHDFMVNVVDALRAQLATARNDALEEAKAAVTSLLDETKVKSYRRMVYDCAERVRALKEKKP